MRERVKGALSAGQRKAFTPVLAKLDLIVERLDAMDGRIDRLFDRLDEVEKIAQASGARSSTLTERYQAISESNARLSARVAEIERLMGSTPG